MNVAYGGSSEGLPVPEWSEDEPTYEEYALGVMAAQAPMVLPHLMEKRSLGTLRSDDVMKARVSVAARWERDCRRAMDRGMAAAKAVMKEMEAESEREAKVEAARQMGQKIAEHYGLSLADMGLAEHAPSESGERPPSGGSWDDVPAAFRKAFEFGWPPSDDGEPEAEG